jgi:hypothetical protein
MSKMPDADSAIESGGEPARSTSSGGSRRSSASSSKPSTSSTRDYVQPSSVRALTAQVLKIATKVANGTASPEELDEYRLYAALTRTAAQLISTDVQRARFLGEAPNLDLDE